MAPGATASGAFFRAIEYPLPNARVSDVHFAKCELHDIGQILRQIGAEAAPRKGKAENLAGAALAEPDEAAERVQAVMDFLRTAAKTQRHLVQSDIVEHPG